MKKLQINYNKNKNPETDNRAKISLCTTCMGRLHYLQKTIKINLVDNWKYQNFELVILDYNSPDGLEEWVRENVPKHYFDSGMFVYYKTFEPQYFHMSHAKNMVHRLASGDILCNMDSDNYAGDDFCRFVADAFRKNPNSIVRSKSKGSTAGRICVSRKQFYDIGGYDEEMVGWGHEDSNFVYRIITHLKAETVFIPDHMVRAIEHSKEERIGNYKEEHKNKRHTSGHNKRVGDRKISQGIFVANSGNKIGCGTVYKNFSKDPIVLGEI